MPLTLEQISDRIEINDLLIRYTDAIDKKDYALLDSCFLPDAQLDYTSAGGIAGDYPKVRAWLETALAPFPMTVHYVTNSRVELDGDRAAARTAVLNPMGFQNTDGTMHQFTVGAYYNDELTRTPDGWRIARRVEESAFMEGDLPPGLQIPS
jgi:hypothetical protein